MRLLRIFWCWIKNWLLFAPLTIEGVWFRREPFGNTTRLLVYWKCSGCIRIQISGRNTLPGSAKGISIPEQEEPQFLEITFLGRTDSRKYAIQVPASDLYLRKQFRAKVELSPLSIPHPKLEVIQPELHAPIQLSMAPIQCQVQLPKFQVVPLDIASHVYHNQA